MRLTRLRSILIALTLTLSLGAGAALAKPVVPESIDVSLHSEQGGAILLVSGNLPEATTLPAEIELAVPEGAELQWAGEILGGPVADDPEAKYVVRTEGGQDVYTLTLTKSPVAQVEVLVPGSVQPMGPTSYAANLTWAPTQDVASTRVAVRVPQGAKITQPAEGAALAPGPTGYSYYFVERENAKAGEPIEMAFAYEVAAVGSGATGAASSTTNQVMPILLGLAALGFAVFALNAVRKKMAARGEFTDAEPRAAQAAEQTVAFSDEDDVEAVTVTAADDASADEGPVAPQRSGPSKAVLVTGAIVAVVVVAGVFSANLGQSTRTFDDVMVKEFGQGDACTQTEIPLALPDGNGKQQAADQVFAALQSSQVIRASLDTKTDVLKVEFCDSTTTEEAIRGALAPLGVIAQ